jgi:hypothetical protein
MMPLLVVLERLSEAAVLAVAAGRQAAVLAGIAEFACRTKAPLRRRVSHGDVRKDKSRTTLLRKGHAK